MTTIDLGMMEGCGEIMRMAVRKLDAMKVCGSCEFRYHANDGAIACAKDNDETAQFAGNVCDEYVFINDWNVRK